jgi:hypothetical protein
MRDCGTVRWDGMGWDGMGWDGMGWDGMGWDGMGWDTVRCYATLRDGTACQGMIRHAIRMRCYAT